jgi:hypothetical protein
MPPWTVHDLRRMARSLMSRAGVQRDHAERVLGHAIPGVEGIYDRHSYDADALRRLADCESASNLDFPPIVHQIVEAEAEFFISGVFDRRPTVTHSFFSKIV